LASALIIDQFAALYGEYPILGQWVARRHGCLQFGQGVVGRRMLQKGWEHQAGRWGGLTPGGSAVMHRRVLRLCVFCLLVAIAAIGIPGNLSAQSTVQTQPIDPFGLEVTLPEKPVVYASGTGEWDTAYETLVDAFKTVQNYLDKAGIKASGPAMTIYTDMDDVKFSFQAAIPIPAPPSTPPPANIAAGTAPTGKALKFVHRGSFDAMTQTYDAISHHVEEKQIATKELLIEEYITDLISTAADKLVVNIFVPLEVAKGP
jgi:effector-binding domain-containing protein